MLVLDQVELQFILFGSFRLFLRLNRIALSTDAYKPVIVGKLSIDIVVLEELVEVSLISFEAHFEVVANFKPSVFEFL